MAAIPELIQTTPVEIHPVTEKQWEDYRRIRLEFLQREPYATPVSFADEVGLTDQAWQQEVAGIGKDDRFIIVAEYGGRIVGFVRATRPKGRKIHHRASLNGLYVEKEYRGQKVGSKLLDAMLKRLEREGVEQVELGVNDRSPGARALYEKAGFVAMGTIPQAIRVGDLYASSTLMMKQLRTT